jgi:hypothetical protein
MQLNATAIASVNREHKKAWITLTTRSLDELLRDLLASCSDPSLDRGQQFAANAQDAGPVRWQERQCRISHVLEGCHNACELCNGRLPGGAHMTDHTDMI